MEACKLSVKEAAKELGHDINDDEAEEILAQLQEELEKRIGKIYSKSQEDQLRDKIISLHKNARINAAIQKRNYLINKRRVMDLDRQIKSYVESGKGSEADAFMDILVGSFKNYEGGRLSIDARRQGILNDAAGLLLAELERNDLVKMFQSGDLDQAIYIELFDGFGKSNDAEAELIARAIEKVQKNLLHRKNRSGANIGELINYVVRQRHDPNRLRDAGFNTWHDDIIQLLDTEKTFAGIPARAQRAFLKEAYEHLESGNFQKSSSVVGADGKIDPVTAFKGPANLAKKLSGSRVLHFKDGKSSKAYADKYSGKTLISSVLDGITNDAESIALMEVLGTNPAAMLDRYITKFGFAKGSAEAKRIQNAFAELDGSMRGIFGTQKKFLGADLTAVAASFRAVQNMSKLGFATISSFSDINSKAMLLQREAGLSMFQAYNRSILDVMTAFNDKQRKQFSYYLGTGTDAMLGNVHSRFAADDQLPGMMTKAQQLYFKLNGMQFWNSAQKDGTARILAAVLADNIGKRFDDMDVGLVNTLKMYNIKQNEIALFRHVDTKAEDGRNYVFARMVDDLTDEQLDPVVSANMGITEVTDRARQAYRDELRTKIMAYYADSADAAVPTPGARERAILNRGLARGTPEGEAIRMIMQFKSFPVTFITKGLRRQAAGYRAAERSAAVGIAQMIAGATVMGYISNATKDILKGREPREVFSVEQGWKSFTEAFVAGGGAGIYGDFIFGEFNRYGQGPLETLMGPTAGVLADGLRAWGKFADGNPEAAGDTLARVMSRNIPGINLFYAKFAIDYLVLHNISEQMSPGYLRRLEQRMERDYNSEFFLPPSRNAVQF